MKKINNKNDIVVFILFLLSLGNVLNLFVPRFAENGNYALRLPVQMVSGIISLLIVIYSYGFVKSYFKNFLVYVNILSAIIVIYTAYYIISGEASNAVVFAILRFVSWLAAMLFFVKISSQYNPKYDKYIQAFIFTFILAASKKVFETAKFDAEKLSGGDIAGLTLMLAIPAILIYFKGSYKIILTLVTIFLIFATIRRTAILSLALTSPFIYREFKNSINKKYLLFFGIFLIAAVYVSWSYFGEAVLFRFNDLLAGDSSYQEDSYGSGRNIFYGIVYNNYINSEPLNVLFGNGIGSVAKLLREQYYDINHAHNDILEVTYTFGLVGLFIWLRLMVQLITLRKKVLNYAKEYINVYYVVIISFFIISLSSGSFFRIEMMIFSLALGKMFSTIEGTINDLRKNSKRITYA